MLLTAAARAYAPEKTEMSPGHQGSEGRCDALLPFGAEIEQQAPFRATFVYLLRT